MFVDNLEGRLTHFHLPHSQSEPWMGGPRECTYTFLIAPKGFETNFMAV